jgi:receptor-type tyrosine-protein phosphatase gamma
MIVLHYRIVKEHVHESLDCSPIISEEIYKNYSRQLDLVPWDQTKRLWQSINKHVLIPSVEEVNENPRSRSAKLRAAVKLR